MMKLIASDTYFLTSLVLSCVAYFFAKFAWTKHEDQQIFKDRSLFAQLDIKAERPTGWAFVGNKSMTLSKVSAVMAAISAVFHLIDYIKS